MNVAFVGNQGGEAVLGFYSGMARTVRDQYVGTRCFFLPWLNGERAHLVAAGWSDQDVFTFQDWVARRLPFADEVTRLREEYSDVNWSAVIASERAFTDYSLLLAVPAIGRNRQTTSSVCSSIS